MNTADKKKARLLLRSIKPQAAFPHYMTPSLAGLEMDRA
jgi:hypothetical protein